MKVLASILMIAGMAIAQTTPAPKAATTQTKATVSCCDQDMSCCGASCCPSDCCDDACCSGGGCC